MTTQRYPRWLKAVLVAGTLLAGVAAVTTVIPLIGWTLGRRGARIGETIIREWNRAVCRVLNFRVTVSGNPDPSAKLLVANHVSWLDIVAIASRHDCQFVAKEEVAGWPVMGYLAKRTGTLFVKRGDDEQTTATAERMAWRLRQGKTLMLFPEGTTTNGLRVLRFHSRLFRPAELTGTTVQPIALRYWGEAAERVPFVGNDAFLPHLLELLKASRIDLHLHYCDSVPAGQDRSTAASLSRRAILGAISLPDRPMRRSAGLELSSKRNQAIT